MGLLKHLLFWPVTGPAFLTRFSLEKVEGAVRTELTDVTSVKRELMELQMQLELGDIDALCLGDEDATLKQEILFLKPLVRLRRSDHAPFWDADIPAIMITDTSNFRYEYYHCGAGEDSVERLDRR